MQSDPITQDQTNRLRHTFSKSLLHNAALATLSVGLALFAIFSMAGWAELSTTHHAVQHVLLFVGGVGVGGSLRNLMKRGQ